MKLKRIALIISLLMIFSFFITPTTDPEPWGTTTEVKLYATDPEGWSIGPTGLA